MEKLLKEVVLVSEVSELALEIERNIGNDYGDTLEVEFHGPDRKVKFLGDISWSSDPRLRPRTRNNSQLLSDDESEASEVSAERSKPRVEQEASRPSMDMRQSSATIPFKDILDYWEEPVNKMDKVSIIFAQKLLV